MKNINQEAAEKNNKKRAPRGKGEETTRLQILQAAREVFSEKGYAAANMGDIAELAAINRALPYYYFKGKKHIFQEVIRLDIEDMLEKRREFVSSLKGKPWDRENIKFFYRTILDFMKSKKQMLILSISEGIRGSDSDFSLIELMDPVFSGFRSFLKAQNITLDNELDFLLTSFFFSSMPIIMYVVLEEKIAKHYNYDMDVLEENFMNAFERIYIEHGYESRLW